MPSVEESLEKLIGFLERGFITREEFARRKQALLAGSSLVSGPRSEPAPAVPSQVGAYAILGVIGRGGMGTVYLARHQSEAIAARQGGEVALKVMHPDLARDSAFRARFQREADLGVRLAHPSIVRVHDLVADGSNLALAMELVQGRPLSAFIGLEVGPVPWERATPLARQILEAVAYAHAHGVIHRDIKPENIMVTPGGAIKILDFGIARVEGGGGTRTGTGMGTVAYMAPEQYTDARQVDARADIYALGMTFYEMLAGRLPFEAGVTDFTVMVCKERGDLPPPTAYYPSIPPAVTAALMRALAVDPGARFPSAEAMALVLLTARTSAPAARVPALVPLPEPTPGRPAWRGLPIALGLVVVLVGLWVAAMIADGGDLPLLGGGEMVAPPPDLAGVVAPSTELDGGVPVSTSSPVAPPTTASSEPGGIGDGAASSAPVAARKSTPVSRTPARGRAASATAESPIPVDPTPDGSVAPLAPASAPSEGQSGRPKSIPTSVIDIQIRNNKNIKVCFLNYKRETGLLPEKTTLRFTVEPDGRVSSASLREPDLRSDDLEPCLVAAIKSISFPPFDGPAHTVDYPFRF